MFCLCSYRSCHLSLACKAKDHILKDLKIVAWRKLSNYYIVLVLYLMKTAQWNNLGQIMFSFCFCKLMWIKIRKNRFRAEFHRASPSRLRSKRFHYCAHSKHWPLSKPCSHLTVVDSRWSCRTSFLLPRWRWYCRRFVSRRLATTSDPHNSRISLHLSMVKDAFTRYRSEQIDDCSYRRWCI